MEKSPPSKPAVRKWADEEIDFLRQHISEGINWCAERLGRTPASVQNKALRLGFSTGHVVRPWSGTEIKFLREHYPDKGSRWCAEQLDRPVSSVVSQARAHGIVVKKHDYSTLDGIREACKVDPDRECWIWQGSVTKNGAPIINRTHKDTYVRMHVWKLANPGKGHSVSTMIRPRCGYKRCVNPEHLIPQSWSTINKKSHSQINRSVQRQKIMDGLAKVGRTMLKWDAAIAIRASDEPTSVLAQRYGVSASTISRIRRGVTYQQPQQNLLAAIFTSGI